MEITIFGAGRMGRAIGLRLAPAGHSITYVSRTMEHARQTAEEVKAAAKGGSQVGTATHQEVALGEVVVLAVKYSVALDLARQLGDRLARKVVVDMSNPFNSTYDGLTTPPDSSAAEEIAKICPSSARVVKAFNTIYSSTLPAGQVAGQPLDVFIAGNDAEARDKVAQLVKDGGMRPVDCGALHYSRELEGMELIHIIVQKYLGTNARSTIKVLG